MTAITEATSIPQGRKASRPVRRQQLIDATIVVLGRKGYSALTVADVARTAGLSVGIINFHFESKEKLLAACLMYLAEEYYQNWKNALATPGTTVAEKLQLVILGISTTRFLHPTSWLPGSPSGEKRKAGQSIPKSVQPMMKNAPRPWAAYVKRLSRKADTSLFQAR